MTVNKTPTFKATAFSCPFCSVLTTMSWVQLNWSTAQSGFPTKYWLCQCDHCKENSLWELVSIRSGRAILEYGNMIAPARCSAPFAHQELPEDCKIDYAEAREISGLSPRGAAALLRLCLEKLCIHLGGKGKKIDDDIAALVKKGLPLQIQQALDYVRVTGNNAVHPGEISLEDSPEHVTVMFEMINLIVEELIHRPKVIADQFAKLPAGALEAIVRRDTPKGLPSGSGD